MKVVSRVLAAFLIAALVLPALATPTLAAQNASTMNVDPTRGPVGTEVELWGRTQTDNNARGWVYYEAEPDRDVWVRVLTNAVGNWRFYPIWGVVNDEEVIVRYDYETDIPFEIPESPGGPNGIAIVRSDLGATATTSQINANRAPASIRTFIVEPTIEIVAIDDSTITRPADAKGPVGTEVEVRGTGFGYREDIFIYFEGDEVELVDDIRANDVGSWSGSFIVPQASQGLHDITAGGDYTDDADVVPVTFEVTPGISIDPKEGTVGSEFTVKGSGFGDRESDIEILFNGTAIKTGITADVDGLFEASVTVPEASMGEHEIGARGDETRERDVETRVFEVEPSFTIEPLEGHVGTEIEVSAYGLPANATVTVAYAGQTKGTGTAGANGTLAPITFTATHPQATHTPEQTVTVIFDDTTITRIFEMDSTPPPTPAPRAPEPGERIGLVGKQTPTLAWTVVEDPSGVTYSLQIATAADFSQVLISKSGLVAQSSNVTVSPAGTEMRYTLGEEEALPYGTYYWRVQAVDGAMNESGWSASSSFKVGLLPTWALIVIAALAVILIAALVYVLIIRDRVGLYD